ncbi:glycerol-3-phosphate 1-O-acyltransferase PlsY [Chloroflexota bacterium]
MVGVEALVVIIGYLLGSIPFAYIVGRLIKRIDIRQAGGGNVGALNTMREVGTAAGLGVLAADVAKGAVAVLIAQWLGVSLIFVFIAGLTAVLGHNWPVFLKFRGGMGLATTMGALLAVAPIEFVISFAIMVVVVLITSNIRLGAGVGLALLPLIIWGFGGAGGLIAYSLALPIFSTLRAIPSIKRDLASAESKKDLIVDRKYKPWQKRK